MPKRNDEKVCTIQQYIRSKALAYLGLIDSNINPQTQADRLTFVNDLDEIRHQKIKEYNAWYSGDSDEIMNFYTKKSMIDYNTDPLYTRNKKSYYWSVSSTESDIKRTHSGQPRNIVDTLVNIVGYPKISSTEKYVSEQIEKIYEDNDFKKMLLQEVLPFTLVEGWGCFKINYDTFLRDTPILLYYRAESVDFIFKSNQIIAAIFKDFYQDEKKNNYLLFETRRIEKNKTDAVPRLIIEKELFKMTNSEIIMPVALTDLPELRDVEPVLQINNFNKLLAVPCIIYKDNNEDNYGRSIFTGKIDMFDDLDQCLSQSSMAVRRSSVQEYFNSNYLEKDRITGLPIMPHSFDRKYVMYNGGADANGSNTGQAAVQVTQPAVNFQQYDMEAQNLLLHIISGIMSPATLGIDIAKKDNAEAQREKEKVTIFTRNVVIAEMTKILKDLTNQLLITNELMNQDKITCRAYSGISVKFDEFADSSFEKRLETLLTAYNNGVMSEELFIEMLYKDQLSEEKKQSEIEFIRAQKEQQMNGEQNQDDLGMLGALLGGNNNNPMDMAMLNSNPDNMQKVAGIPEFAE